MSTLSGAWRAFSQDNRHLQQFGQQDDESVFNGSTGCTHVVLQRLIKAKTGQYLTLDEISSIASYPWPANNPRRRGMYSGGSDNEAGRVIARFRLPYRIVVGYRYETLRKYVNLGPVMLGVRYGYIPEWRGYRYGGLVADGQPNGFAIRNGATQLTPNASTVVGRIYHAVLWLPGVEKVYSTYRTAYNDPNHGSPARPERPDYDVGSLGQVKQMYEAYGYNLAGTGSRKLIAWVPTGEFRPRGY